MKLISLNSFFFKSFLYIFLLKLFEGVKYMLFLFIYIFENN
jgi:hypothetical protein